jgi:arylsulfatase A-like enzyme
VSQTFSRNLHLLVLWSFAVAQPLYAVLRENREFFVAHRSTPVDLILGTALLTLALPGLLCLVYAATLRVSARAARILHTAFVAILLTAFVSQMFAHFFELPAVTHFALAAAGGILGTWLYSAALPARTFVTYLSPSVVIFPALFLLHPSMRPFVRSADGTGLPAATVPPGAPPIVMVVFDQLPLTSLLSPSGGIDPRYPHFAALADDATWFRNATTVAELTGWALPALASGVAPQRSRLPTVHDYPGNLFTALGSAYHYEVIEPITHLCPEQLCAVETAPLSERLGSVALDASVVYLHVVLPPELRALLPPLTQDWKDFVQGQHWQMRWISARDADRRDGPRRFVESISRSDPQPTLYFLHALLPHEPYIYLRSGQQFTDQPTLYGLRGSGRWGDEAWPVVQAYRYHLLQLQYVDTIVGQITGKLKAEGLFDKALIVVTGDHGVSFRPGQPFKGVDRQNLADIMAVPLFIKLPGQQDPVVSDRNVQSIDIVPTIADILKAQLPWHPDGRSALVTEPAPSMKFIRHLNASRQMTVDAEEFAAIRRNAVDRKFRLFASESDDMMPAVAAHAELVGRDVDLLDRSDDGRLRVFVNEPNRFLRFNPAAPEVAGLLSGRVMDDTGHQAAATLAIAVNGKVRATTATYRPETSGENGIWTAFVPPSSFRPGPNEVEVFVVREETGGARLERAYASSRRPASLNLASQAAHDYWSVTQKGLYPREGGPIAYRWTTGDATIVTPRDPNAALRSLRLGLARARPATPLTIVVNGCTVFSGPVESAPWFRTFPLDPCREAVTRASDVRIRLQSPPIQEKPPGNRMLGVAVETINVFDEAWPPSAPDPAKTMAAVEPVEPVKTPLSTGTTVDIEIANRGESVWLGPTDKMDGRRGVDIVLRWRPERGNGRSAEQRMALPRTFYPEDRAVLTVPVVVPESLRATGPWELAIAPSFQDGTPMKVNPGLTLQVREPGK